MMIKCPVEEQHILVKATDNNDSFYKYHCATCNISVYDAITHDYIRADTVQLHKDYEILDIQQDIYDEQQLEDLMCSETQRLFNR